MLKLILSVIFIHQVSSLECDSTDSTFNSQDGPCKQCLSINNVAQGCKESESLFYIPFDYCFARSDLEECKCVCQEDNCNSNKELKCKAKESDQLSFRIQYFEQIRFFTPSLKTDTDEFFEYMEANFNGMFEKYGRLQNVSYINTTQKVESVKDGERLTCIDNSGLENGEEVKYEVECEMDQTICKVASTTNTKYVFHFDKNWSQFSYYQLCY